MMKSTLGVGSAACADVEIPGAAQSRSNTSRRILEMADFMFSVFGTARRWRGFLVVGSLEECGVQSQFGIVGEMVALPYPPGRPGHIVASLKIAGRALRTSFPSSVWFSNWRWDGLLSISIKLGGGALSIESSQLQRSLVP